MQNAVHATGAAHGKDTLLLGVDVDKSAPLHMRSIKILGAQKTHLFSGGKQTLQTGMGQAVVIQNRQCDSDRDTVVAAQGRALRVDKIAVYGHVQGILREINSTVRLFLAYHIQMPLDDDGGCVLVTCGSLFNDDHIVELVPGRG